MTFTAIEARLHEQQNGVRLVRVYRHLFHRGDWQRRDEIMSACGYPCPKAEPVRAYAIFAFDVLRLNDALRPDGQNIARMAAGELYRLEIV